MAHQAQLEFVDILRRSFPKYFVDAKVLEIGSLDINGSVRGLFSNCEYTGLDVANGKGVDIVCQGQDFDAPSGSFDVVISCEAMEHNPHWAATFQNMSRLCRPGGLVIMTCATVGRPEHGTTRMEPNSSPLTVALNWEYYRNLRARDFDKTLSIGVEFAWSRFWTKWKHYDLLFAGIKSPAGMESELARSVALAESGVDGWVREERALRALRYRNYVSKCVGDAWFNGMRWIGGRVRRLAALLDRLHEAG